MKINQQNRNKNAFTIVELLVVIVIIGILSTLVIISFSGISKKAKITSLHSDLRNSSRVLEIDKYNNDSEAYPSDITNANNGKG